MPETTTAPPPKKSNNKLLKTVLVLMLLLGSILLLMPAAISYAVKEWIRSQGGEQVSVENVDFNPFTATLKLEKLSIRRGDEQPLDLPALELRLSWLPLLQKQLVVTGLTLSDVSLLITQGQDGHRIQIGGMTFDNPPPESTPSNTGNWAIRLNRLTLNNSTLEYRRSNITSHLAIRHLVARDFASNNPTRATQLKVNGTLDDAPFRFDGKLTPLAENPLLHGNLEITRFQPAPYAAWLAPEWRKLEGRFSLESDLKLEHSITQGLQLEHQGKIQVEQAALNDGNLNLSSDKVQWQGKIEYRTSSLSLQGRLSSTQSRYQTTTPQLSHQHENLQWQGQINFESDSQSHKGRLKGILSLQQPKLSQENQHITLDMLELDAENATLTLHGDQLESQLLGSLKLDTLAWQSAQQTLNHGPLTWNGHIEWRSDQQKALASLDGQLETHLLSWKDGLNRSQTNYQQAQWKGRLVLEHTPSKPEPDSDASSDANRLLQTRLQGELQLTGLELVNSEIALDNRALNWTGAANLQLAGQLLTLESESELQNQLLHLETQSTGHNLQNEHLNWSGKIRLTQDETRLALDSDGALQGGGFGLSREGAELKYANLDWQGSFKLSQSENTRRYQPQGSLYIDKLQAQDDQNQIRLLTIDGIDAAELHPEETGFNAQHITLNRLTAGEALSGEDSDPRVLISMQQLTLTQPAYRQQLGVTISSIEPEGLNFQLVRSSNGELNIAPLLKAAHSFARRLINQGQAPDNDSTEPTPVRIERTILKGDNRISFEDLSTEPVFKLNFIPEQITLGAIDSNQPKQNSPFTLKGTVDENTKLDLQGSVSPFAAPAEFSLQGRIEGLPLPPLSSYTVPLLGYRLQSGKMNSDITLKREGDKLEGNSDLVFNQLEVEPLDEEKMATLKKQLDIPLETALGMLKDKHNQIRISLPISGDSGQIDIDPSDAINQAIGRALKQGAKTYLATALFPFGTLLTLVDLAGDAAAKVRLDPILFEPGSAVLSTNQHPYLEKVAQLLNDRQEIHIRLCGITVESDRQSLEQAHKEQQKKDKKDDEKKDASPQPTPAVNEQVLLKLAADRARQIEQYLTESLDVPAARLISCQPKLDADKKKPPRADLLI